MSLARLHAFPEIQGEREQLLGWTPDGAKFEKNTNITRIGFPRGPQITEIHRPKSLDMDELFFGMGLTLFTQLNSHHE